MQMQPPSECRLPRHFAPRNDVLAAPRNDILAAPRNDVMYVILSCDSSVRI